MTGVLSHESNQVIGAIVDGRILCPQCAEVEIGAKCPLYFVNVYPYRQSCHSCGAIMVRGLTPAWCELFPAKEGSP